MAEITPAKKPPICPECKLGELRPIGPGRFWCNGCGKTFYKFTEEVSTTRLTEAPTEKKAEEKPEKKAPEVRILRENIFAVFLLIIIGSFIAWLLPMFTGGGGGEFIIIGFSFFGFSTIFSTVGKYGVVKAMLLPLGMISLFYGLYQAIGALPLGRVVVLLLYSFGMIAISPPVKTKWNAQYVNTLNIGQPVMGLFLIYLFYQSFLIALFATNWLLGLSFIILSFAFFVIVFRVGLPEAVKEAAAERIPVILSEKILEKLDFVSWLFIITGFFGLLFGVVAFIRAKEIGFAFWFFLIIVGFGLLVGTRVPGDARPLIGLMCLSFALMAVTTTYPAVMGQAIFGGWWPTVFATYQTSIEPILEQFEGVFTTFRTGWVCLTDPVACRALYQPPATAQYGYQGLEIRRLGSLVPELRGGKFDDIKSRGFKIIFELENKGDRDIKDVQISLVPLRTTGGKPVSEPGECEQKCSDLTISPGEIRQFIGNYTITGTADDVESGEYLTYGIVVNYSFSANATLDVEVIDKETWERMRRAGQFVSRDVLSTFTGGPVELAIGVGTQPIRDDIGDIPITISLRNVGPGFVGEIKDVKISWAPDFAEGEKTSCDLTELTSLATGVVGKEKALIDYCMVKVKEIEVPTKTYYINAYLSYVYIQSEDSVIGVWYGECAPKNQCIEGMYKYCNENYEIVCLPACCPECPEDQTPACQNNECTCVEYVHVGD